jgi:HlyD family secretion protein
VPAIHLAAIGVGHAVRIHLGPGAPIAGTVRRIEPEVDAATRQGRVRLALAAEEPGLVVGMAVEAAIATARAEGLVVPSAAVLRPSGNPEVVVVDRTGTAQRRTVRLGLDDGARVLIRDGLVAGEQVVAIAPGFVADGAHVEVVPLPDGSATAASAP